MAKLVWDLVGERFYETGVDRGVLYPRQTSGVAWNGLISVAENISGGETEPYYFDGTKYYDFIAAEDFQATVEAFSAPAEFAGCNGTKELSPGLFATQQIRHPFGLSYRTRIGNDLLNTDYGYKLHLVYNATASPSAVSHQSISDRTTPGSRSWTINTVPPLAATYKPTAHFIVDSTKVSKSKMTGLENLLYGSSSLQANLPTQAAVIAALS